MCDPFRVCRLGAPRFVLLLQVCGSWVVSTERLVGLLGRFCGVWVVVCVNFPGEPASLNHILQVLSGSADGFRLGDPSGFKKLKKLLVC